jgi:hypothetical protein
VAEGVRVWYKRGLGAWSGDAWPVQVMHRGCIPMYRNVDCMVRIPRQR